jgi:hypothetical protein
MIDQGSSRPTLAHKGPLKHNATRYIREGNSWVSYMPGCAVADRGSFSSEELLFLSLPRPDGVTGPSKGAKRPEQNSDARYVYRSEREANLLFHHAPS